MDIGTVMSVIQTLLAALESSQLKDFCSKKSLSSQVDQLQVTVKRIQGVLLDAESKQVLSKQDEAYLDELKDVVFEADDLFDEFLTLAQQNKLNDSFKDRILSLFTKLKNDYKISHKVDTIKQKLDNIAYSNQLINFKHDPEPIKNRSRETCSYVHSVDIIGRDDDLEKIVGMLLNSDGRRSVSFLSIVGIGGLGKTALAQLVFNDPRVTTAFSLKLWTCVSDQDQNDFDVKEILRKILEAATNDKHHDATKERLQSQLRQLLEGNRYLLVLDDVWTENREQWCMLEDFLMGGQMGSWVLVTTRSRRTSIIVGDGLMYDLEGLSKENSWRLFERAAFGSELSNPPEDLASIGQKIVEKCANLPLAIRVAGSLLYGQEKCKWVSFQELPLTKFEENKSGSGIMPILKLSYHHLESTLKSCFGYCAIFPKNYELERYTLTKLWMAQGYIQSSDERNMEDIANEYFLVLVRRCFFQDLIVGGGGVILACKMHDLMHDVAQEVIGKEIYGGDDIVDNVASTGLTEYKSYSFNKTYIRSYLHVFPYCNGKMDQNCISALIANWKYLRVLYLPKLNIESLPSTIGELLHLRYLDLSYNYNLEMLPRQITKLHNLQSLCLTYCERLKELPKDMSKLVKLRHLNIQGCDGLRFMPKGMGNMRCLQGLSMFVVREANSGSQKLSSGLDDLKALTNLKYHLEIKIEIWKNDGNREKEYEGEGGYLINKPHLLSLGLRFNEEKSEGRMEKDEGIIEELQPHSNLKSLKVLNYEGVRMPKWAREDAFSYLKDLWFDNCSNIRSLGCLGTLHHLTEIHLLNLRNLVWLSESKNTREGIREKGASTGEGGLRLRTKAEFSFFPYLERLILRNLPQFQGWWRGVGVVLLPKLEIMILNNCPNLTATMECPALEFLVLNEFNKNLGIKMRRKAEKKEKGDEDEKHILEEATMIPLSSSSSPSCHHNISNINEIIIDDLAWLNSQHLHMEEAVQCLQILEIIGDNEVQHLGEGREVFCKYSSLRFLEIADCSNLRSVSGGIEHLTALRTLKIANCPKLCLAEGESVDVDGMPWESLSHSLGTLILRSLPQLVNLPSWIQDLTVLQTLEIDDCENLGMLPSWMPEPTSLRKLCLIRCSEGLKERCKEPIGEDWPHIQHISSFSIMDQC